MTPTPPVNDDAEHVRALQQAMAAREQRAELKDMVARGDLMLEQLLDRGSYGKGDPAAGRISVADAVRAVPGIGPGREFDVLLALSRSAGLSLDGDEHLNSLSHEQRLAVLSAVIEVLPE